MIAEPTQQFEALWNEMNKLIKKEGWAKAILKLHSFNKYSGKNLNDISLYEYIIKTILSIFNITETQLYHNQEKFLATDARRSAYVLIKKYMRYNPAQIAVQFNKRRSTVAMEIIEFNSIIEDSFYKEYHDKHNAAEKKIIEFVEKTKKGKKKPAAGTIILKKSHEVQ